MAGTQMKEKDTKADVAKMTELANLLIANSRMLDSLSKAFYVMDASSLRAYYHEKPAELARLKASDSTVKRFMDGDDRPYSYMAERTEQAGIADRVVEYKRHKLIDAMEKMVNAKYVNIKNTVPKKVQ